MGEIWTNKSTGKVTETETEERNTRIEKIKTNVLKENKRDDNSNLCPTIKYILEI